MLSPKMEQKTPRKTLLREGYKKDKILPENVPYKQCGKLQLGKKKMLPTFS